MIVRLEDLTGIREKYADKTIVLGSGVFDLLHVGHLKYLRQLQEHGDIVVVLIKSDERVNTHKGSDRPVISEKDRAQLVNAIEGVNYVFVPPHREVTDAKRDLMYEEVLGALKPDIFYSTNNTWKKLEGVSDAKVIIAERHDDELASTTAIIRKIRSLYKS